MTRLILRLFGLFLVVDTVAALASTLYFSPRGYPAFPLVVLLGRMPIVAVVLVAVYFLVRTLSSAVPRIDPYVWFVIGIDLGYLLCFVALSLLGYGSLFDVDLFMRLHTDRETYVAVVGPYILAFLVTSIVYFARWRSRIVAVEDHAA